MRAILAAPGISHISKFVDTSYSAHNTRNREGNTRLSTAWRVLGFFCWPINCCFLSLMVFTLFMHEQLTHFPTMDASSSSRRDDVVKTVFIPIDVGEILKIPLCARRVDDFWAWSKDNCGAFSVRSAYRMILHTKLSRESWLKGRHGSSGSRK